MVLRRSAVVPPFVLHVKPVRVPHPDHGARHVAALVLIVEPGRQPRLNPNLVATTLDLTPAETQVAIWLEGRGLVVATRGAVGPSSTAGGVVVGARACQHHTRRRHGGHDRV